MKRNCNQNRSCNLVENEFYQRTNFAITEKDEILKQEKREFKSWNLQGRIQPKGLYNSKLESDGCGVGFIVNIDGSETHTTVIDAIELLSNLSHRGGCCEENTGDGAGISVSIPHEFLRKVVKEKMGEDKLPARGRYAVGNVFFFPNHNKSTSVSSSLNSTEVQIIEDLHSKFKEFATKLHLDILAWRDIPFNNSHLGKSAKQSQPFIQQVFVIPQDENLAQNKFEAKLYILRKKTTHLLSERMYVCSLSNSILVYKGLFQAAQVDVFFQDLRDEDFKSQFAMVHSRYSTNTIPTWRLAHPFRILAHNGEINALAGNSFHMKVRESSLKSGIFSDEDISEILPVIENNGSDASSIDNVLEFLVVAGIPLPEAVMIIVPEAWESSQIMPDADKSFYKYHSCLMEPWDGPALLTFVDGHFIGAVSDRNGLRPGRFYVTNDNRLILASEAGVLPKIPANKIIRKDRILPGKLLLIDLHQHKIVGDDEIKRNIFSARPYAKWLQENLLTLEKIRSSLPEQILNVRPLTPKTDSTQVNQDPILHMFGYSLEEINMLLTPMVSTGKEPLGSMGNDAMLGFLSAKMRTFDLFQQRFAQVTNPPIDPNNEQLMTSLQTILGPIGNILDRDENVCKRILLDQPILTLEELEALKNLHLIYPNWKTFTIDITFSVEDVLRETGDPGGKILLQELDRICTEAYHILQRESKSKRVILVLSDRNAGLTRIPLRSLMVCGCLNTYLSDKGLRSKTSLIIDCGDAREVHHHCLLLGNGADAICPYMIYYWIQTGFNLPPFLSDKEATSNYIQSINYGILKVMAKMGIVVLESYKGASIFEAIGVSREIVDRCFRGSVLQLEGRHWDSFEKRILDLHRKVYPVTYGISSNSTLCLPDYGKYHWRAGGETHFNSPTSIALLQEAAKTNSVEAFEEYVRTTDATNRGCTVRGMLRFKQVDQPIPLDEVEPAQNIVKRFCTGAMSFGSISIETHETIAIAMNSIGAKSNTGEGGESSYRFKSLPDGTSTRSAIKQIASGRFGVTINYLANSDEIQIKMAQGAKPGEGGELPGHKVSESIANTRLSTPGVGLISPPPHHDIYSIEDLAQLIYDLKQANPSAKVSVKLVSGAGVGIIASGVAKANANKILISGHDGGTGASSWTGIKHAGCPWELGLADTQQTLVINNLRGKVLLETDGQLKTGRDVVIAALLGAEEFGFATAPLIVLGCTMMRKCHLNTCPVGIATHDPVLRAKFQGKPEHLINFLFLLAEDVRNHMASLGFRTIEEMIGRSDRLEVDPYYSKTFGVNLDAMLTPSFTLRPKVPIRCQTRGLPPEPLPPSLGSLLVAKCQHSIENLTKVSIECSVSNVDRTVGAMISYFIALRYGEEGLPDDTIHIKLKGSAGQSLGAWLAKGVTIELEGDSNDYLGKGLSGGRLIVYPPRDCNPSFIPENNVIVGNVVLYGASSGETYLRGIAADRFAIRNSGAIAVVEGCGNHGCEYMTRGRVVVLGNVGFNFAAGMSGGIAFVYDPEGKLPARCNQQNCTLNKLEVLPEPNEREDSFSPWQDDAAYLHYLLSKHALYTGSTIAQSLLKDWSNAVCSFVRIIPNEYGRILESQKKELQQKNETNNTDYSLSIPEATITTQNKNQEDISSNGNSHETVLNENLSSNGKSQENASDHLQKHHEASPISDIEDIVPIASRNISSSNTESEEVQLIYSANQEPQPTSLSHNNDLNGSTLKKPRLDKLKGFMKYSRIDHPYRDAKLRVQDWNEIYEIPKEFELQKQAARCMDCGIPFCQTETGCPIRNVIPRWNDLVHQGNWREALDRLMLTNNFPEFTGRVCPAPCEGACVLSINSSPVTIKTIEGAIIERAFEEGWVVPHPPHFRSDRSVAIIGSGPAGLAAADQLNKVGHNVTVFERDDRIGGLLMYGIPPMKLDKSIVQRRVDLLQQEGIKFVVNAHVGENIPVEQITSSYDAVLLAVGAQRPREVNIPGRYTLKNIHYAMEYLKSNQDYLFDPTSSNQHISVKGKRVVVIGGGDTGVDCVGTAIRQGAKSVVQLNIHSKPSLTRESENLWPQWPHVYKVEYGHEEVATLLGEDPRKFCVNTKEFIGDENGNVSGLTITKLHWSKPLVQLANHQPGSGPTRRRKKVMTELTDELITIPVDFVFIAIGFSGPEGNFIRSASNPNNGIELSKTSYKTDIPHVYSAGDCRRGQSLIVWAINEGRQAARDIDLFLMGSTTLPL